MNKIISEFDDNGVEVRRRVVTEITGESRVEQSHRDECNINKIMAKYYRTGLLPQRGMPGHYGDFTGVDTYHEATERVMAAQAAFMELPSQVRKQFNNDPAQLLAFLADDNNREKAIELGIIPPPEPVQPEPEPETPETPAE